MLTGGSWGVPIGLMVVCPFVGFAVGAAPPEALADIGISDTSMKDLAATMAHGSSTLFVIVKQATPDRCLKS